MRALAIAWLVALAAPVALGAQVRGQPPRPAADTLRRAPGDTTARDTTALITWAQTDSVMDALLARPGFTAGRYQAGVVRFDVNGRVLRLTGDPAAIERTGSLLVADTIIYIDSTQILIARGDTNVLRDPSQGADIVSAGELRYDLATRTGLATRLRTAVESGDEWFVTGERNVVALADSARGRETAFYVHEGAITSCNLTEPHYHFRSREIKVVAKNILVARPAVLYIADVPVMWLPFVFQDLRKGRRSGLIPPSIGVSDIVRNSPTYRRQVENLGWYFVINDYADTKVWLDWRSGARPRDGDPGFTQYSGEFNYTWLSRFLSGGLRAQHKALLDNTGYTNLSWQHRQQFSQRSSLNANLNYTSSTVLLHQTSTNPYQVSSNIVSNLNYQNQFGPVTMNVGGRRTQYTGRPLVTQELPSLSLTSKPINVGDWLTWTPQFSVTNQEQLDDDRTRGSILYRFRDDPETPGLDSTRILPDSRIVAATLNTPINVFDFVWNNSFRVRDEQDNAPTEVVITDVRDTTQRRTFVFNGTPETTVDWETSIGLPRFLQGSWNVAPSVSFSNVDPSPFWVRNYRTGGQWVNQAKRPSFQVGVSPTFYGLYPGFGNFQRFRHMVQPSVSYSYAPEASVSDEFLAAIGSTRQGYRGALRQSRVSLNVAQTIEAKLRSRTDTSADATEKLKLLSLNVSPLAYDFVQAREGGNGFVGDNFNYSLRSDLLPGFDLRVAYDLFQGDPLRSDTAVFDPYRTSVNASFSVNRTSNPLIVLYQLFGRAVPPVVPVPAPDESEEQIELEQRMSTAPIAGANRRGFEQGLASPAEWQANFMFSSTRQRPIPGALPAIDAETQCAALEANPFQFQRCVNELIAEQAGQDPDENQAGQVIRAARPTRNLAVQMSVPVTQKWAAQWSTNYDFIRKDFAEQVVSLQRDLHDWRAVFAFSRATNGAFSFNFFIALKPQPDLKFDYHRATYPSTPSR